MNKKKGISTQREKSGLKQKTYRFRLFIAGASPNSTRAVLNLKAICEGYMKDDYELEIIDIHQQPLLAETEQIIAVPMVIKKSPLPQRRLIGDMSNTKLVLRGIGLAYAEE